jgi:RNA polymerase sigma-70 factor (ECF subfamily)
MSSVPDHLYFNFEQFADNVFRFALSLTGDRHWAEDLTQDCFLKAHRNRNQLKDQNSAKAWLFQITANLWKDELKRKQIPVNDSKGVELPCKQAPPIDRQVEQENFQRIVDLMQDLPSQQRTVLFLSAVEQFSNSEIANLLGKTENTIKANLSIARKKMREKIIAAGIVKSEVAGQELPNRK